MADNAAQFIGSIPQNYDTGLGPHIFEPYARDLAGRIAAAQPHSVLELAAGTGIVTRQIRSAIAQGSKLVVTDLNAPMLEIAKAKVESVSNTTFQPVDAMELPFEDGSFDAIACQFGVMFFPDKVQSYREALRVLKPGGKYIFNSWGSWNDNPFARITYEVTEKRYPHDPPVFYKVPFHYHDAAQIRQDVESAGFANVMVEELRFSNPIASVADFARGLIHGNPVSAEITERGGDCDEVRQELEAELVSQLGGTLDLLALVVTASKPF